MCPEHSKEIFSFLGESFLGDAFFDLTGGNTFWDYRRKFEIIKKI